MSTSTSQGGKNKRKGSGFERDVAKMLSKWIYGDTNVLRRHPTSGSEKDFGSGADIALFQPGFKPFNYYVEVKCGYKDDLFNARKQILTWYTKAKKTNKFPDHPIWIIWKLLNRGIIIASENKFNCEELYRLDELYIYDFKELVNNDFDKVIDTTV